jgi:hypothetical protein
MPRACRGSSGERLQDCSKSTPRHRVPDSSSIPHDAGPTHVRTAEMPTNAPDAADATSAWEAFLRAGRRLERRFPPGASGVRLLSDMRR